MTIGILGGGLSGLALQYFLDCDCEVLEKENKIGGLCRTFEKDGFLYDIGGHILFSKNVQFMQFIRSILAENINYAKRNNKILYNGRYVKYPFENELSALDKEEILECLYSYLKNNHPEPKNFREWIYYTFGSGIAEKYLVPYNQKIWKHPLEQMGLEWVQRVPKPPLIDILKSAIGIETQGYLHQLHFNYPLYGGIEALPRAFAGENSKITTGFEVKKIRKRHNEWLISDGAMEKRYDEIVLTIPIHQAVKILENVPAEIDKAVNNLRYNSVRVVFIGIDNESLMDKSAIYIPSQKITAHRICFMGYFSPNNVPKGKSSLIAEITTNSAFKDHSVSDTVLIERLIEELHNHNLINRREVVAADVFNAEYGYVVYDINYSRNIILQRKKGSRI